MNLLTSNVKKQGRMFDRRENFDLRISPEGHMPNKLVFQEETTMIEKKITFNNMTEEYPQDQRIYFHIKKKQKNTKTLI